ncbi:uncharacterized protein LOC111370386 [Olea europaea var. sylvestris]|uniref:uncharacterized protein LOC111370386 n=1 Tax=Olea europaea var. sylvestris TaxID=158386 RepID=UPI000C1CD6AA|nr:uncharacterized protein LOC111370386 [Olea europaea var. sylvestris]XP_022847835.1 uncharacterized protein LOC111370386 [Olea europaea var. sylvestris]XP_022847836.1 uncharacterized protein LOC111370386 [Olea europaea var. sylvestris]
MAQFFIIFNKLVNLLIVEGKFCFSTNDRVLYDDIAQSELEVMARGNKIRRVQDMLSQPPAALDRDASRVEESVHPTHDQQRYRDVAQPDLIADRIATDVASALRNTDKDCSMERATKLGAEVFTGAVDLVEAESLMTADPVEAESWMVRIERIFDVMDCLDD